MREKKTTLAKLIPRNGKDISQAESEIDLRQIF
jgi:hypothetical protein